MNLRHLKLWKRHHAAATAANDVSGDVGKSRGDVVDVRSPSSDSGYSDVAPPTFSSMFSRHHGGQPGHHHGGHLLGPRADQQREHRAGRSSAAGELSGRRKTDTLSAARHFRGLKGSSTPRSAADSTRRTLSPPSADAKSPTVPKATTTTTTSSAAGVTAEAFFALVREGNVDKLRQFLRDTKFDVNARDTVCHVDQIYAGSRTFPSPFCPGTLYPVSLTT